MAVFEQVIITVYPLSPWEKRSCEVVHSSGGVPVVVDGQVIGTVGVGGGTGEQDADVARAGIKKLLDALKK